MNGWLLINKPKGIPSFGVTKAIKRMLGIKKIGHCGTLDPFADGLLPLAIGEATKTIRWLENASKQYTFTIKWGVSTDTGDVTGKPTAFSDKHPTRSEVTKVLKHFRGSIMQTPPIFSAIKVNGKRAYKLARSGETPTLTAREICVHKLSLISHTKDTTTLVCVCSKGTYIRAIASDIGKKLDVACHTHSLTRDKVGNFDINNGVDFSDSIEHSVLEAALQPVEAVLHELPSIEVDSSTASLLARGVKVPLLKKLLGTNEFCGIMRADEVFRIRCGGKLVAVATTTPSHKIRPIRVFNFGGF